MNVSNSVKLTQAIFREHHHFVKDELNLDDETATIVAAQLTQANCSLISASELYAGHYSGNQNAQTATESLTKKS